VVEAFSGVECRLEELALQKCYRVSAICAVLGCSERHLYAVFLRDIGLPPKTWMNMERMVVARRKLKGGKTEAEIAADLGFLSIQSFRRGFSRVYRVSPKNFLKSCRLFDPSAMEREGKLEMGK
jgi:AraC-like DNA-binding protein